MSYRPSYMIRFPGGHVIECDSLVSAIEQRRGEGTVYERLGLRMSRSLDHEEALVAAIERILAEPDGCPFCDSGTLRTPDNPAKGHTDNCGFLMAQKAVAEVKAENDLAAEAADFSLTTEGYSDKTTT